MRCGPPACVCDKRVTGAYSSDIVRLYLNTCMGATAVSEQGMRDARSSAFSVSSQLLASINYKAFVRCTACRPCAPTWRLVALKVGDLRQGRPARKTCIGPGRTGPPLQGGPSATLCTLLSPLLLSLPFQAIPWQLALGQRWLMAYGCSGCQGRGAEGGARGLGAEKCWQGAQ